MLRNLLRRMFGRHDTEAPDESGVARDRLVTHPTDHKYDEGRGTNEAFDAGVRSAGGPGPL
ncbi:MAG: hypothetical protein ABR583_11530 [Gaiellaceae bacterium]